MPMRLKLIEIDVPTSEDFLVPDDYHLLQVVAVQGRPGRVVLVLERPAEGH